MADTCTICFEPFEGGFTECGHAPVACSKCYRQHCAATIATGQLGVRCVKPECRRLHSLSSLIPYLSESDFGSLSRRLIEAHLHASKELDFESFKDWAPEGVRLCPKCQVAIEKDEGCAHMRCMRCDLDFCWSCMLEHCECPEPDYDDYYSDYEEEDQGFIDYLTLWEFENQCSDFELTSSYHDSTFKDAHNKWHSTKKRGRKTAAADKGAKAVSKSTSGRKLRTRTALRASALSLV
mmetsp:Transcript_36010/g.81992  ORF Transcript_36010/g.81992 Transcript_36010/m.81992 type:complete len:237 (+) Transcript_36010:81-791(+)